jgi:hypothetical protein
MISLKQFMELVDYRITEGSDYCWDCYGSDAYSLSYWNQDHSGHSFCIIFNTKTHTVYEVQAHDYLHDRAYRLIHPAGQLAYAAEARQRDVAFAEAWDNVNYVDLETDEDFLDKAQCIIAGEDYDTRIDLPLRLDDDALFELMKQAHERDITLNQLVEDILRDVIAAHETGTDDPINFPTIQSPAFPADNFTQEQARKAVKKPKKKVKRG